MIKKILCSIVIMNLFMLYYTSSAYAWDDQTTHGPLTAMGFDYLVINNLIDSALSKYRQAIVNGSIAEDTPFSRSWFHFYPRLNSSAPSVTASGSAYDWAFNPSSLTGNMWGYTWALRNEFNWTSAVNRAGTNRGWEALGHVIHLLEDMAVPAHVRNDPHPPGDGDPLELWARSHIAELSSLTANNLITGTPQSIFNALQSFTRNNFFSSDTIFSGAQGPIDEVEDSDYFYDKDHRRIAHKSLSYWLKLRFEDIRDKTLCDLDDTIIQAQFTELTSKAALYAASLIKYYYDHYIMVTIDILYKAPLPNSNGWGFTELIYSNTYGLYWNQSGRSVYVYDYPDYSSISKCFTYIDTTPLIGSIINSATISFGIDVSCGSPANNNLIGVYQASWEAPFAVNLATFNSEKTFLFSQQVYDYGYCYAPCQFSIDPRLIVPGKDIQLILEMITPNFSCQPFGLKLSANVLKIDTKTPEMKAGVGLDHLHLLPSILLLLGD
jgi:hypothetical protein